MSGREKVGLQSKSSNVRKDEKFLEEKKERDVSKTRSQGKTVKTLSKKIVTDKSINTSTESKSSPRNKTKAVLKSRRKNTSTPDKTTVIRRTRQSDEFLELNTELIKQSPTIIDKLISKNKSAIQKNKLKLNKQSKTMPEKSVKQLDRNDSKKNKNQSNIAKYNVNRKKIDAGKLLATTIARKKLKASQACIEKNAKKRLLRSNDLITNGDKKSLIESKVKPKLNSDIKKKANIIKKIKKSDQINNGNRVKDENGKIKATSSDNTAGPSNYRKENADQVKLKSNADILENISPLVRPLKKLPNAANVTLTRWKLGLHNRGRGRGRGRGVRGRGHGIMQRKFSYLTRSDSPVPLLRNGKRRMCDSSDESIDHLRKRKRNLSCEFNKSDSIADDQSSYATDSEYSFCDSVSTVATIKGEKDVDLDDSKIKVPLSSPTNYMSSSKMDSNSNLFNSNDISSPSEKILNSTKLSIHSPSEFTSLLESKNSKSDSSPMIINGADNVKSDCSTNNESVKTKLYKCSSENVTNDLTGKIKPTMKRLSTDSKSDSIVEDMSDCDISSKNNNSSSDKKKKKLIRKKVKDNSLWVRRSLRGVQKNEELKSIVSEILKLASDDEVLEKPKSPKESIPDEKSSEYDSTDDYCLIIEDSPKKTDEQSKITNTGSSILFTNRRKSLNDSEIPDQSKKIGSDNCNKIKRTKSLSESNNERIQKTLTMQTDRLNRPFKNIPLLANKTKPVNLNTMLNESNRRTINSDKSPIPVPLVNKVIHDYLENDTIVLDTSIEEDDDEDDDDTDNNNADVSKNNKQICDPDVTIIETDTELIVVEDDDEDCENNNENNKNIEDENCKNKSSEDDNELDVTKELIEQNKIAKIIESLEVDELNDNTTVTIIPETEQNSTIILPTKDTPNKNNDNLPTDTTVCNDSEETEMNTNSKIIVNQDNVETEAEADEEGLTESEAETEIEENIDTDEPVKSRNNIEIANKIINIINCQDVLDNSDSSKSNNDSGRLIRKSNDSLNINFSDQSCSSSSYISAVTEFPTSMDSDVLEINDNLSSNDCTNSATCNETIKEISSNENNTNIATTNGVNIEMKKEENKENENEIHLKITDVVSLNDDVMLQKVVEKDDEQSNDTTELHQKNEIEMIKESPEERANKESILTALGLKSLHNQCETKLYKSSDNTYTGTLKAVIKLNRNGDKSGARKMFFKQIDTNEKDSRAGGDVLEYRICSEADQPTDIEQSSDDNSSSRKLVIKQRTSSLDETSNSSVSAFASTSLDSIAGGDGKDDKGAPGKESSLVIPEKSSSFSIHPGRLCSDICSYCFGKFGSLDTPCHLAQLKNAERQQKILAVESHLKMDSCLCDGCYRFVDRKANSPQIQRVHKQKRRNHPPPVCAVQGCTHLAQHSIRKKWLVKLRKSISKQLDIEMEKHPIVPLCNQHYSLVDYFTFCGLCKKRLTRNHMYALGSEANELNYELKKDSIPVKLTDKLFLCKLCRHYSSLRLKYKDTSVLNSGNKIFLRSYRKKILACHDIVVSESEDESSGKSVEDEKEKSTQDEQSMKTKKRRSKSAGSETKKRRTDGTENNDDEPQMIDYSCLDSLQKKMDLGSTYTKKASDLVIGPGTNNPSSVGPNVASSVNQSESAQDSTQESQSGDGQAQLNLKISNSKVQKLNNTQPSKTSAKEKSKGSVNLPPRLPGEKELALSGELKREDNGSLGRNGWEKYSLNLQFDKETKRLWNELQRPYGNQSSFLRHLVMLEKYWRSGSLVLAENADPLAVKYNNRAKTRVQAYDGPPVRPKTVEIPPATKTSKPSTSTPTITVTSPLSVTTPSIASSSCLTSSINSVPELVKVITKSPLLNSTAPFTTCATSTSVPITPPPTQLQTNGTLAPPPLLKLDGANSMLWHKVHSNQNQLPVYIQPNRNKQIKVVVTSVSNSSVVSTNKSTSNVISVLSGTNTTSSLRAPRPIAMTFQQFQSFQKRMKDIKIASPSLIPVINNNNCSSISNNSVSISSNNSSQMLTNSSTTITSSAALAAAKAVTIVTTATATTTAPIPSAESSVTPTSIADTFNPMICNVLSLAGSPMTWGTSNKKTTNTGATNKVTYYTPILPKLPKTLTVRHIVPVNSSNKVSLNSSVTIEKTSGIDSPSTSTLVPEKPSISVFREECSDKNV